MSSLSQSQSGSSQGGSQGFLPGLQTTKLKVPSISERLEAKQLKERNENRAKIIQTLTLNHQNSKQKYMEDSNQTKKKRTLELLDLKKSMSDGQPKHPRVFRKMNQILETFQKPVFLFPRSPQEALEYQAADMVAKKERHAYLKLKTVSNVEEPWNPTQYIADYFDNRNLMKSPQEFRCISDYYPKKSNRFQVGYEYKMRSDKDLNSRPETTSNLDKTKLKSMYQLEEGVKPTSANNLVLFQQQLTSQKTLSQITSSCQQSKTKSSAYFGATSKSFNQTNKEWINAFHEKQTFGNIIADSIDIKVKGDHIHFKPFKPSNTQSYAFNKYISLDAGEREFKNKQSDFFEHLEQEPLEIKVPKKDRSFRKNQF